MASFNVTETNIANVSCIIKLIGMQRINAITVAVSMDIAIMCSYICIDMVRKHWHSMLILSNAISHYIFKCSGIGINTGLR